MNKITASLFPVVCLLMIFSFLVLSGLALAQSNCTTLSDGSTECTTCINTNQGTECTTETTPPTGGGTVGGPTGDIEIPNPIGSTSILAILQRITNFLIVIGAPIATIMVLYGAFMMLTAGANAEKFRTGIKAITYAAIGYGIVLIGSGIIAIVRQLITG